MAEEKKPLIIVLGRNYSTALSVIRSLGAAGYDIDMIASSYRKGATAIAAKSKYVRKYTELVYKKNDPEGETALIKELLKYAEETEEKIVLFPSDDYTVSIIDANRHILKDQFVMPYITAGKNGSLIKCMDKTFQGELARSVGLCTPLEWIISLNQDIIMIPNDMVYPCFCKPLESIGGYKKEMAACASEEELRRHLEELKEQNAERSVLVQEFLNIDQEIDLSGVSFDQDVYIPAIIKKSRVAQYQRGITLSGRIEPFNEIEEIKEKIIQMMRKFHYCGMFDMELNVVGDKIYFNEVNFRSGGPNYIYCACGVNLPEICVRGLLGERKDSNDTYIVEFGKTIVSEKVAWEDYLHGFMTWKELVSCIRKADVKLMKNADDPIPGRFFWLKMVLTTFRRKLGVLKRKLSPFYQKAKQIILRYPQCKKKNERNPYSEKPRVIVAGRNYSINLCMARSLGEAGYEVEVVRVFQKKPKWKDLMAALKPDAYSKYVKAYHVCITNRKSIRIIKLLKELADPNRKMLLLANDDLVASAVDLHFDELKELYLIPNVNDKQGEIDRMMSKGVQKELALASELPVLNSCVIKTDEGNFEIPSSVTYPCFMKPNISKNSSKTRMRKCDSRDELECALKELSEKKDIEMIVEDYIEIVKEYSLLGVSTNAGVFTPGVFAAEEGGHDARKGVAMIGKILSPTEMEPLISKINRFIGGLHYEGLFDVDLIEDKDGKIYFVELNLRYGASGFAVTESGVNLPGMFADYMISNKPIDQSKQCIEGKRFISEKILIDEYLNGFVNMREVKQKMNDADIHFIKNAQDRSPYKHFKKFYFAAMLKRTYRQLRTKMAKE